MGGKTWQQDEEELFWLELIPQSPEGLDPGHRIYSWKEVADVMHERLGSRGYRNYNHQLIYEHFYQNCKSNHPSPRAKGFVRDYMQRRGNKPIERPREPKPSKDRSPMKRRTTADGPSKVKRSRCTSEDKEEHLGISSPSGLAYRYPLLSDGYRGEVAHAASQTTPFDGNTINPYWPPRRPLPCSPRFYYGPQYSGSPAVTNDQREASVLHHETISAVPNSDFQNHDGTSSRGDPSASYTNTLPPLAMEPRIGSVTRFTTPTNEPRTPLPSISSLRSSIDAARPPRLQGILTSKNHGPMFEALLSAASASSAEPSPKSMFSRSESFSQSRPESPASAVNDDNGTKADEVNGSTKGKDAGQRAQTEVQQIVSE